jgi:hypothetical protein
MDNDVHTHPKEQDGNPFGSEPEKQRLDLRGKSVAEIVTILTSDPVGREGGTDQQPSQVPASPPVAAEPSGLANEPATMPRIAGAPSMAPGIGGPNLGLQPLESHRSEGEAAVEAPTRRMSHGPVPAPPMQARQMPLRIGRLALVAILAAIGATGVMLLTFPSEMRKWAGDISGMVTPPSEGSSRAQKPATPARLVVEGRKGFTNEPLPLGISLNDASGAESVTLAGLEVGTRLSAGAPLGLTSWQLSARDVPDALVYAPKDFVGTMVAAIDLRTGDWLMDSRTVRLEWMQKNEARSAPPPEPAKPQSEPAKPPLAIQTFDAQEIAALFRDFLKNGDTVSARLLLKQSANAGNAQAALELGMTFDPAFVKKWNVPGFAPDVAQAREWYGKAIKLGSTEASGHLARLTGAPQRSPGSEE